MGMWDKVMAPNNGAAGFFTNLGAGLLAAGAGGGAPRSRFSPQAAMMFQQAAQAPQMAQMQQLQRQMLEAQLGGAQAKNKQREQYVNYLSGLQNPQPQMQQPMPMDPAAGSPGMGAPQGQGLPPGLDAQMLAGLGPEEGMKAIMAARQKANDPTKEYGPSGLTRKGVDKAEEMWRKRLEKPTEGLQEITRKIALVNRGLDEGTGAGDIAAINAYQRMIDDGVVRSEDINLQASATSLTEWLKTWIQNKETGEMLSPEVRTRMRSIAEKLAQETALGYSDVVRGWKGVVDKNDRLDWGKIFPENLNKWLVDPIQEAPAAVRAPDAPAAVQAPAAPSAASMAPPLRKGPPVGKVENGYRFKGGDPGNPDNWEPIGMGRSGGI